MRAALIMTALAAAGLSAYALSVKISPAQYQDDTHQGQIFQSTTPAQRPDGQYSIGTLNLHTPPLAPGPGLDAVQANCQVCHSTSYITMQPPLPAATWEKEVAKMRTSFGATFITDEAAQAVVAYLSAHYTPETRREVQASASASVITPTATAASARTGADAAAGAKVFATNCAACHGPKGHGGIGPNLKDAAGWKDDLFKRALKQGIDDKGVALKPLMPKWPQLTEAQMQGLQAYLKTATR